MIDDSLSMGLFFHKAAARSLVFIRCASVSSV